MTERGDVPRAATKFPSTLFLLLSLTTAVADRGHAMNRHPGRATVAGGDDMGQSVHESLEGAKIVRDINLLITPVPESETRRVGMLTLLGTSPTPGNTFHPPTPLYDLSNHADEPHATPTTSTTMQSESRSVVFPPLEERAEGVGQRAMLPGHYPLPSEVTATMDRSNSVRGAGNSVIREPSIFPSFITTVPKRPTDTENEIRSMNSTEGEGDVSPGSPNPKNLIPWYHEYENYSEDIEDFESGEDDNTTTTVNTTNQRNFKPNVADADNREFERKIDNSILSKEPPRPKADSESILPPQDSNSPGFFRITGGEPIRMLSNTSQPPDHDQRCPVINPEEDLTSIYSYYAVEDYYHNYMDYSAMECELTTCYLEALHTDGDYNAITEDEPFVTDYRITCNRSVSLTNLTLSMPEACAHHTTHLVVSHQLELCAIWENDLQHYSNLTYVSITNTSLNYVEDGSFGNLAKLQILDLRDNRLHVLSWRTLWPHAIPGQGLRSINVAGNPLQDPCGNAWLLPWQQSSTWERRIWEEEKDEEEEEEEEGEIERKDGKSRGIHDEGREGRLKERRRKRRRRRRRRKRDDGWTQDTREMSRVPPTDDCPSSGNDTLGCYLCAASLKVVNESGEGACKIFTLECSASGNPEPEIEWQIPEYMALHSEVRGKNPQIITITLNGTRPDRTSNVTIACIASNTRDVSVERINLPNIDENFDIRKPEFCQLERKHTFAYNIDLRFRSPKPWVVKWLFYPCKGMDIQSYNYSYYKNDYGDSRGGGYLKFRSTPPTGKYEVLICTSSGFAISSIYISNQPSPIICTVIHAFPIIIMEIQISTPTFKFPSRPKEKSVPMCPVLATTTSTTTTTTTTTQPTTPRPSHHSPIPLSIVLTIVAGLLVLVIGATWMMLRNLRWPRYRQNTDSVACPNSPFQLNFMDEECQKKQEGLHTQELMPISAERLVDNPEYIGNGLIPPSKPQVKVIQRDKVKFVSELGEGAFGRVYLGVMEEARGKVTQVAIKTLKSVGPEARIELEREGELLSNLTHANIVSFYGVSYGSDSMLMVFEYMEHGDLNNYLRSHNEDVTLLAGEEASTEPLSVMDCLQIALQVAAGMKYLASQHYVHRDLATRNCLVGSNMVVKIGDFGMSRDVYTTDYYQFGGRTLLPVRWMPPESILYRRFTIESDIWSFGVVLWEIFTGGKQPWYGYNNQEVITQITGCKMLSCPERCTPDMYRIMLSCWRQNPQERPSMATLYDLICSLTTVEPHVQDYD